MSQEVICGFGRVINLYYLFPDEMIEQPRQFSLGSSRSPSPAFCSRAESKQAMETDEFAT